jgi:hypothetical protein
MTHVPVFTQQHLRQAYELFMDPQGAERWSAEWWAYFAGSDVDEEGYLLAEIDLWRVEGDDGEEDIGDSMPVAGVILTCRPGSPGTGGFEILAGLTADEKGAHLLNMGFTDFTMNLVSLVSDDVARRVRELRNSPQGEADEGLLQARLIVEAIRPPQAS